MTNHNGRRVRRTLSLAAAAVLVPTLLVGCSGGESDSSDSGGFTTETSLVESEATQAPEGTADSDQAAESLSANDSARSAAAVASNVDLNQLKVVSTGTVSLSSRNADSAVRDVQQIVDEHSGVIGNERTETSEEGEIEWARLVLRVPTEEFDEAMGDLKQVGTLENSTRKSTEVTAEYVDLESRVRAQRRSLERVEVLYNRASNIKDIMSIETQVASRQAELDSLTGQLRVLEDQTSLSTITVHVSRAAGAKPVQRDEAGFQAGLNSGWEGLTGMAVSLATVVGVVLPYTLVALPLLIVAWLLGRRLLARRPRKVEASA